MLRALGVSPADVSSGSGALLASDADEAAIDTGVLARTVLVKRLLPGAGTPERFEPLSAGDVRAIEASLRKSKHGPPVLPDKLRQAAQALLAGVTPSALAVAGAEVTERWIASLAPLEPTLVTASPRPAPARRPPPKPAARPRRRH
jgi:hypothetical protein